MYRLSGCGWYDPAGIFIGFFFVLDSEVRILNFKRRSAAVTLLVLGVSGCGMDYDPGDDIVQRDVYASRSDCEKDWGNRDYCQAQPGSGHALGPSYTGSRIYQAPDGRQVKPLSYDGAVGSPALGVRSVTRSELNASPDAFAGSHASFRAGTPTRSGLFGHTAARASGFSFGG